MLDEEHDVVVPARPLPDIARAWVERADEEVREQDLLEEFARCRANLREAAAQYFNSDQLRVTIE